MLPKLLSLRAARLVVALMCGLGCLNQAKAISIGQTDTFQDGTLSNWLTGGTQPTNVATGGPLGSGDRFMELTADASGSNSRLTVLNRTQWTGNYIAAGVNEIDLDLNNLSNITLSIRLAFKSSTSNGAPGYVSTTPFSLAANSGWQHAVFSITSGTMTAVGGPSAFAAFFTGPAEFRIINATANGDLNGNFVVGQLGIDNIVAVPEPSSVFLFFGTLGLLGGLRVYSGGNRRVRR